MNLFINKDKTLKTPLALNCFCMGIVFCIIFGMMYFLLTAPLHTYLRVANIMLSTTLHAVLIALVGTVICCLFFFLCDKRIVPGAFLSLAVFLVICCLLTLQLDSPQRTIALQFVLLHGLGPVFVGNLISWAVYLFSFKNTRKQPSTPLSETW